MEENLITDHDTNWKEIVSLYFEDFTDFFMPYLHPEIDYTLGVEFLDKELAKLIPARLRKGTRIADKLAKVKLKNGLDKVLLIHIEFEATPDKDFADRMFEYFYRIYDKFKHKVEVIALFVDKNKSKNPNKFEYKAYRTQLSFTYHTVKLIKLKESELIESTNPFALAALAVIYLHKSGKNWNLRKQFKMQLARLLFSRNYDSNQIDKLFIFIGNILTLPDDLELEYYDTIIETNEKAKDMALTLENSRLGVALQLKWKKQGREEGREEGIEKGIKIGYQLTAIKLIKQGTDTDTIRIITALNADEIEKLRKDYLEKGDALIAIVEKGKY